MWAIYHKINRELFTVNSLQEGLDYINVHYINAHKQWRIIEIIDKHWICNIYNYEGKLIDGTSLPVKKHYL